MYEYVTGRDVTTSPDCDTRVSRVAGCHLFPSHVQVLKLVARSSSATAYHKPDHNLFAEPQLVYFNISSLNETSLQLRTHTGFNP